VLRTQQGNLVLHIQAGSHSSYNTHSPGAARGGRNEQDHADAAPPFLLLPGLLQLVLLQQLLLVLSLLLHLAQALPARLQLLLADRLSPCVWKQTADQAVMLMQFGEGSDGARAVMATSSCISALDNCSFTR
jgi:hypothetical protein